MKWTKDIPTVDDIGNTGEEYYWVRGGLFNRPIMVLVVAGVTSTVVEGVRKYYPETNFTFVAANFPPHIWASKLPNYPGLVSLEWAGPVPRPEGV